MVRPASATLNAALSATRRASGPGSALARFRQLAPYALVLLGLVLAWATQVSPRLRGAGRYGALALGLAVGAVVLSCLVSSRWWRSRSLLTWLGFWLVWAATLPWTLRPAPLPTPDPVGAAREAEQVAAGLKYPIVVPPVSGREEVTQLALAAVVTGVMLLLAGGTRRGVLAFRALWLAVVVTTAPVAIREIATDQHIITTAYGVWFFAPHIPAGPFQNPNNYACVLACSVGVLLVWALDRPPRWLLPLVLLAAALAAGLAFTTGGRAALVAIVAQAVAVAVVALRRRRAGGLPAGADVSASRPGRGVLRLGAGIVAAGLLVAASFLVPALQARNPLARLLAGGGGEGGSAAYDSLRLALTRTGLRYWQEYPWLGTGAGTFETRLATELPRDVSNQAINVHNGFVELLSQYGIVVFAPFALLLGLLAWRVLRPGPVAASGALAAAPSDDGPAAETPVSDVERAAADRRRTGTYRLELALMLFLVAVTAVDVSSALALPLWFVMIAHATHLGWALERPRT